MVTRFIGSCWSPYMIGSKLIYECMYKTPFCKSGHLYMYIVAIDFNLWSYDRSLTQSFYFHYVAMYLAFFRKSYATYILAMYLVN